MAAVPDTHLDLFEKPTIAHITTITPSGKPHATPVWIDYDPTDGCILINTERGRQKERNAATNPTVAVSMTDPEKSNRYLSITGIVTEITTDGAREHIDTLASRYTANDTYANPIKTERVLLRIQPELVFANN